MALSGDCTIANTGAITCTKTSGVAFAPSATTDTTNAANISSGTLPNGRLSGSYTSVTGVGTIGTGIWQGTTIGVAYGGTGVSNPSSGVIYMGNGSSAMATSALSDNGTIVSTSESVDLTSKAAVTEIANAGTTGTTVNKLAKLTGAPSTALITATTDTSGAIGIVIGGAGTSSNAQIATAGQASCVFENATVAGDYVQIGSSTAGDCHDAGSTYPTSGQVLGRVLSTNSSSTTPRAVALFGPEIDPGGSGIPAGTTGQVQYNSGSSTFAANSNLTYLSANDQLVVGTGAATPVGLGTTGTVATAVANFIPQSSSITSLSGVSGEVTVNTAATGQMAYYSGSNALSGTSNLYVSGSNIGIGTTTASALLSLDGSTSRIINMVRDPANAGQSLTLQAGGALVGTSNGNGSNLILSSGISTGTGTSNIQFNVYPGTAGSTSDNTATTALTITGAGLVGIGTTSPITRFDVKNASGSTYSMMFYNNDFVSGSTGSGATFTTGAATGNTYSMIQGFGTGNTTTQPLVLQGNGGNVGIGNTSPTLAGLQVDKEVGSTNAMFGTGTPGLSIVTNFPGIYFNSYYSSGNLFMGTGYAGQVNFNPTNGTLVITTSSGSGTAGGSVTWSGGVLLNNGATSWASNSDRRLKNIIEPITDGLLKVEQINPVIYRFKTDMPDIRRAGIIAQDVQKVLPEAVTTGEHGYLNVAYTDLIPLTISAIHDLKSLFATDHDAITKLKADEAAQIAALKAANDNQAAEIRELTARLKKLESVRH